jgi:hypothetical protein
MGKQYLYWDWIKAEAKKANSDGCSFVPDWRLPCCHEHDIAYAYAKDPRDAYRHWRNLTIADEQANGWWDLAEPITRGEADKRFRQCNQKKSKLGKWSPFAAWRWVGVRLLGRKIWAGRHNKG